MKVPAANGKKTILIVGASFAGFTLGEFLWSEFNVVFLDQNDYFEYTPGNVKSAVDDKWADKITISYSDVVSGHKNKFKYIQGKLLDLSSLSNLAEIELTVEGCI